MTTTTAAEAVVAAIRSDVDRLVGAEPAVRADAYDSIHQMRVATRRLRSVLRSFRGVFDKKTVTGLRDELRWLGGVLGVARDAEVRAERFEALLAAEPSDLVAEPVAQRLVGAQRERYAAAHAEVLAALDSPRYAKLRAGLADLLEHPDGPDAGKPSAAVLMKALGREYTRLRGDVRGEFVAPADHELEALHDIRKDAKRLRYAAEAAAASLGESAELVSADAKTLQSVLGDHRDAVESQHVVLDEAQAARAAGEDTFAYGLFYAAEERAARKALAGYHPALDALTVTCRAL
ncbi:MAG TPA: CHAD domain-containing protein [Aldersonia sp.]